MTKRKSTGQRSRKSKSNNLSISSLLVVVLLAVLVYLINNGTFGDLAPADDPVVVSSGSGEWYEIYFTNPSCPPEEERQGGLDETIAADMRQAELQVDVAAFDFDAEPMVDALVDLVEQGVRVRVVTDSDNADLPTIARLRRAGVDVVEDERSALMHNKFVVIDGRFVWMGSMNFASNDVYCHNNNIVRFDAPELAANYTAEMNEMFDDGLFGPTSPDATLNERLSFDGVLVENYFASEKEVAPIITQAIEGAQNEILFMAFSYTNEAIGEAMLARAEAGINVQGVYETTGSETDFSYYLPMLEAGLANMQVRQDGNNRLMHHKVIIIDRATTIFGSFNFSDSANDSNDENVVIVHDPTFTGFFVEEFNTVWNEARP
jgi:phosphatidylserine/phosphatidylglycerophosphate/cardiolipin synthase-like enzyme